MAENRDAVRSGAVRPIWTEPWVQDLMARSMRLPEMRRAMRRVRRGYLPPVPVKANRKRGWR